METHTARFWQVSPIYLKKSNNNAATVYIVALTTGLKYKNIAKPKEIKPHLARACLISAHYICEALPSAYAHAKYIKKRHSLSSLRQISKLCSFVRCPCQDAVVKKYTTRGKIDYARRFERMKGTKLMEELAPLYETNPSVVTSLSGSGLPWKRHFRNHRPDSTSSPNHLRGLDSSRSLRVSSSRSNPPVDVGGSSSAHSDELAPLPNFTNLSTFNTASKRRKRNVSSVPRV
ncbi:hypothetical protein RCL_jg7954.t1 [Rhizophagus clarus]|uniref:Uncharacterized protein n=1 Tax=Rhizophagus clarus TaxID=94130 RepID=A0A8H3R5V1_9GLOM|nr:hypothetical protein RCL_jg7954.t1 [Rhizophagus clarus]